MANNEDCENRILKWRQEVDGNPRRVLKTRAQGLPEGDVSMPEE